MLGRILSKQFWHDLRVEIRDNNLLNGAAALGFYLTLAIFPALIILLAIVPYVPIEDVDEVILDFLQQGLPEEAANLVERIVAEVTEERRSALLSFGVLATVWIATTGMNAIMRQLNVTHGVKEGRGFVRARLTALILSIVFAALVIGAAFLIALGDVAQDWLSTRMGYSGAFTAAFEIFRWVVVLASTLTGFALIYRYAPNVQQEFRLFTPGSVLGAVLLILASLAFSLYVRNFADYGATYGSIGAVIILMLWLYVAGLVILLGSEVDVLLERYRQRCQRDAA